MKTHHIIYEVIFNNGNKSIYQYELKGICEYGISSY